MVMLDANIILRYLLDDNEEMSQKAEEYIKNGDAVADATLSAMTISDRYPKAVYNFATRVILFSIIPALFYTFVPVKYILVDFNIFWILGYFGVTAFWVLAAFISFKIGLKKYNSSSLMSGRL